MTLTLGFSPCPNDTFIFDALVNKKIDTEGLEFDSVLADVETLNQWALEGRLAITKLSFPAYFGSLSNYSLLHAGCALGKGVGPLLVADSPGILTDDQICQATIALPGLNTTANLLFSYAYPGATVKKFMLFSAIEDAVLNKEAELGVIIHENRFTYRQKGLHQIKDLGEYWEERTGMPIPLGGIAVNQSVKRSTALKINELIQKSAAYALSNYPVISGYVKQHAQAMQEEVMRQHIDLYVNNFTLELGEQGQQAIKKLYQVYGEVNNLVTDEEEILFL